MTREEKKYFTGEAIVVFNDQEERDNAIEYFSEIDEERNSLIREYYPEYDPNL